MLLAGMRHRRSTGRWLAPVALLAAAVAVYAIATGNRSDGGSGKGADGRTTTTHQTGTSTNRTTKPARRKTYTVKPGDVLSAIAAKTGLTVEELQRLNPNVDAQTLQPGDKLKLR
jgi:LysM repeat protein